MLSVVIHIILQRMKQGNIAFFDLNVIRHGDVQDGRIVWRCVYHQRKTAIKCLSLFSRLLRLCEQIQRFSICYESPILGKRYGEMFLLIVV